jgi:hypothetical protein
MRTTWIRAAFVVSIGALQTSVPAGEKKLIQMGIDGPDTVEMLRDRASMERTPFDGWVFYAAPALSGVKPHRAQFSKGAWQDFEFAKEHFAKAVADLKQYQSETVTENFLRMCVSPGAVDWFDDRFSVIVSNMKIAAWIVKEGGQKGLMFDLEQYPSAWIAKSDGKFEVIRRRDNTIFNYQARPLKKQKSIKEYAAKVRIRGKEIMQTMQEVYPDITIILPISYPYIYLKPWPKGHLPNEPKQPRLRANHADPRKIEWKDDGLLAPFIDGLIEAAGRQVQLFDGGEFTYTYITKGQYNKARQIVRQDVLPLVGVDRQLYEENFKIANAVWLDCLYGVWSPKWDSKDFSRNFWQPAEFQLAVANAMRASDKYTWVYAERVVWRGPSRNVPKAYEDALFAAKEEVLAESQ